MTNISLDLSNKVPNKTVEIIKSVQEVAEKLYIPVFLIGATARELVLQYGYGLPKSLATRDVDFGVAINSWADFEKLKAKLIQTNHFQPHPKIEHRLFETSTKTEVDIVPFGKIESPKGKIKWQQSEREMNTAGFIEAYNSALNVKLSEDFITKIVSPVGLAILKIIAWNDRQSDKDSSDFWLIASNYLDIGDNEERIYENYTKWLEEADYDYKIAGARLLGIDIAGVSNEETKIQITDIFSNKKKIERLAFEMARFEAKTEDNFSQILKILKAITEGLSEKV